MEKDRCSSRQLVLPFSEFEEATNRGLITARSDAVLDVIEDNLREHWYWSYFGSGPRAATKTSEEFSSGSHS